MSPLSDTKFCFVCFIISSVRAEEIANCKDVVTLQFKGHKLDKKDFFGKSDPFLVISRSNEDQR